MIESVIERLRDVLFDEITNKLKQAIKDKQELQTFQDNLQHWIQEFISKNGTTIINSSDFSRYIEHYNIIGRIVEYITVYESQHIDEKTFINSEIEKIIEFLKDNNNVIASNDRTVITDFVNGIFNNIKNHFFSKLPIESTPILYEVNQLRNEISGPKNKVQKKFFVNPNLIERTVISYDHIQDLTLYYNLNERKNLYDVCQKERYVILLGEAGSGKTIALKQTAHYACDEYHTLLISLSNYTGEEINNLICNEYSEFENLSLF